MWRQAHYRAVVETAVDAIVIIDEAGRIQSSNPATERIFGYRGDEMVGHDVSVLMPVDHAAKHGAYLDAYKRTGERKVIGVGRSVFGRRKNGDLFPLELSIAEWIAKDGQRFFTGTLRDIGDFRAAKAALLENQEWLRTVSDIALAGLVVIDRNHRIRFSNRAYAVLFDLDAPDLAGFHLRDVLPAIYDDILRPPLDAAFAGMRGSHELVYPENADTSRRRHLAQTYEPSRSSFGDPVAVVVVTDVTDLKRSEIALRVSRDLLQSVIDGTPDAIFAKDSLGRYVAINEGGARLLGVPRAVVIGRTDEQLRGSAIAEPTMLQDRAIIRSGEPSVTETTITVDGRQRDFSVSKRPWAGPDGASGGVVGIARDVTQQRLMAAERRDIAKRLMAAQEAERLRLARELHDQVGQDLTGLSLGLKDLERDLSSSEGLSRLWTLRQSTDRIARNLHRTALELRPTSLEDLGLRGAIASHIAQWSRHFGLPVDVFLDELDGVALGADAELALYRCVQETLTNILKHAKATGVSVVAQRAVSELRVIVEDNGIGFDTEVRFHSDSSGRLGLVGMRERMSHVDGTLTIESAPGRGTSVYLAFALAKEKTR